MFCSRESATNRIDFVAIQLIKPPLIVTLFRCLWRCSSNGFNSQPEGIDMKAILQQLLHLPLD
jgi:hypothetical protein